MVSDLEICFSLLLIARLRAFYDAVRAGTGNVMCSFNRLNNSYACQNSKALNGLLKGELGFQGWVVSDWGAQKSGVASAVGGLDAAMPNSSGKWGANLTLAISNGTVQESQLDNMATRYVNISSCTRLRLTAQRIIASWYQMKQDHPDFPAPGYGMPSDLSVPHVVVDARNKSSKQTLLDGAVEGHVLVKNTKNALPLKSADMKLISLFGYSAKAPNKNNFEHPGTGLFFSSWGVGVQSANITEVNLGWFGNLNIAYSDIAINGTLISGGGSGAAAWSLMSAPYDALVARAQEDGTALYWDFESASPLVNPTSNACLVFGNTWASEGYDRPSVRDDFTDALILDVADQCANTIVVFHNAGTRLVDQFIDHPNITAVIFAHLPGQDSGRALVSLLYGDENFSGRLPYTVARNETDYGALLKPDVTVSGRYQHYPQSDFSEGVFIDYRHFDAQNITPRYEFGFGLSYTTFDYSSLIVSKLQMPYKPYPTESIAQGGQTDLWDELAIVSAEVTNTGSVAGKEVVQLYLGIPGDDIPARQLRGFEKPSIQPGETVTVQFHLTRRDLSVWDVVAQKWHLQKGQYKVFVGSSSRNLPLEGSLAVGCKNKSRR